MTNIIKIQFPFSKAIKEYDLNEIHYIITGLRGPDDDVHLRLKTLGTAIVRDAIHEFNYGFISDPKKVHEILADIFNDVNTSTKSIFLSRIRGSQHHYRDHMVCAFDKLQKLSVGNGFEKDAEYYGLLVNLWENYFKECLDQLYAFLNEQFRPSVMTTINAAAP